MPPAPAEVLDVGGEPGACAARLARAEYIVHPIDPVALHIAQARAASDAQPADAVTGAGRGLSAPHLLAVRRGRASLD